MSILQIQPQFHELDKWTAFAKRHRLSFEAMDVSVMPLLADGALQEKVCRQYLATGLVSSLHGAFIDINPASADPLIRSLSVKRCEESCALAKQLGADTVVFHSSCFPFLRGKYVEQWADLCAEFYCALAARYHLTVCVENSMDLDTSPLNELMRRADNDAVAVCLDVGHANDSGYPMEAWFSDLNTHIRYLHLSDNAGRFDEHLPLGAGTVDWKKVSALCQTVQPQKLTLEVGSLIHAEQSLAFLRENNLFGQEN